MLATHTGIYDVLPVFLVVMTALTLAAAVGAVRLLRGRGWRVRAAGGGVALLAVLLAGVALQAPAYARYRNRCVDHHSDIPLCYGRQPSAPGVPVRDS